MVLTRKMNPVAQGRCCCNFGSPVSSTLVPEALLFLLANDDEPANNPAAHCQAWQSDKSAGRRLLPTYGAVVKLHIRLLASALPARSLAPVLNVAV